MPKKSVIIISIIVYISIILIIKTYYQTNTNIYENNSSYSLSYNIPFVFAQDDNDVEYEDKMKAVDFDIVPIMKIVGRDFSEGCKGTSQFPQSYKLKIERLKGLNSSQLMEYPYFTSLPDKDVKIILHCLDTFTLKKVLLNIPINDLINIYNSMIPAEFNKIIYKLGDDSKVQIMNRMVSSN